MLMFIKSIIMMALLLLGFIVLVKVTRKYNDAKTKNDIKQEMKAEEHYADLYNQVLQERANEPAKKAARRMKIHNILHG